MEKIRGAVEIFASIDIHENLWSFSVIILQFVPSKFAGIYVAVNFMICRPLQEMHKEMSASV